MLSASQLKLALLGLMASSFWTFDSMAASLNQLERKWGITSLKPAQQHPLEKIEILPARKGQKGRRIRVASWYEDRSITNFEEPGNALYCRFMHNFIYGRAHLREGVQQLPLDLAFSIDPSIQEVEFQYFALVMRNKPSSPYWDRVPNAPPKGVDPKAQLRVLWTREEKAIPYLSVQITRDQWRGVSQVLRDRPYYSYSAFEREACDSLFRLIPKVKASFQDLRRAQQP